MKFEKVENTIKECIHNISQEKVKEFNKNYHIFSKEEVKKIDGITYRIFADDENHAMPYTAEASIKTLYRKLARFIRVVDYMLLQLRINIITKSFHTVF